MYDLNPPYILANNDALQEVNDLLYGAGVSMPGLEMAQDEAELIKFNHFPYMDYCLVRDWIWVDLDVSPEQHAQLSKTQRQPAIIFANTVIYDSSRRFDVGDFVRTSPLYKFEAGFIFATLNCAYLLMGDGVRKRASLETVGRLF
ncbi:conserved hypothetical protein [Pseudomonas sp. 8BK]|uniref:DUF6957 family protein n=1 Tax=Pseudomonas sp. 8BK TaxID=2653164 RepID=UPI0012F3F7B7|nr:hypothetical protein [Pseudomonas sp. 8BK]VXC20870.1 conserved hypothetical protein [Pseudomonas sp. 8BK]